MAHFALVTAAELMHEEAHSGTASADSWQGDSESQVSSGSDGSVVVGGSVVAGSSVVVASSSSSVVVVSSSGSSVGVDGGVGSGSSVGSGAAVATQPQTEGPAAWTAMRSAMFVHAETTQSIALAEMASELVGSQRQLRSVASHPTCPAALLTQGRY